MSTENTGLVVAEQQTAVSTASKTSRRFTEEQIENSSLDVVAQENLPDLSKYKKHFMSLETEYWSPEPGEEKMVWIMGVGFRDLKDMVTGELKPTECALLAELVDGKINRFIVAGTILVSSIKENIKSGVIIPNTMLTPVSILYKGEKKNKNNQFKSRHWVVTPLIAE